MDELSNLTNEELWQLFPILLQEHDESWKSVFAEEKDILLTAIGLENVLRLSHIGSTAVPGIVAKPTVDILIEIKASCDIDALILALQRLGYRLSPQPDNPPPHLMFLKGYTPKGFFGQCFHLHIRYAGDWPELYFRDYLLIYPDIAQDYSALKKKLWYAFEHDRDGYTGAKTDFVQKYTALARREFPGRYALQSQSVECR